MTIKDLPTVMVCMMKTHISVTKCGDVQIPRDLLDTGTAIDAACRTFFIGIMGRTVVEMALFLVSFRQEQRLKTGKGSFLIGS